MKQQSKEVSINNMTPKEKCDDKGSLTSSQFADNNNSKVSLSLEQRQLLMSLLQQDDTQLQGANPIEEWHEMRESNLHNTSIKIDQYTIKKKFQLTCLLQINIQ
ncbi:hypothetical protein HN51_031174 [Arachis hypogaea]